MSRIPGIIASGNSKETATPLPAEGPIFAADVQVVPPGSGVIFTIYGCQTLSGMIRNSGVNPLLIYPIDDGTIDGIEGPYSLGSGSVIWMEAFSAVDWLVLPTGGGGGGGYVAPTFSAFSLSGQSSPVEVGATIAPGSHTFAWATTSGGNVAVDSISIADATASVVLASGVPDSGSQVVTFGSAITSNSEASRVWTISGVDTHSDPFGRAYSVAWEWRVWSGSATAPELDAAGVQALSGSILGSSISGTYSMSGPGYKYVCVPTSFSPPSTFVDASTGFNVPMCTTANDASFSGTDGNGNNYLPLTLINANSIARACSLYRTQNSLGSALSLRIS